MGRERERELCEMCKSENDEKLTNGLNYHGVHFVRTKLQLVTRETMGKTQRHSTHFRLRETCLNTAANFDKPLQAVHVYTLM